ncbi:MAG: bifunctional diaminohydroxyphosphoribosylaminopyrimidine deaminase/5-amino-6-(5-phosphoribosylamino)uracil reductase RibD [Planctomycetota bacterium]
MDPRAPFMARAIEVATHGLGRTSPNPCVGAVAVREGVIVAEAHTAEYGGPHAEAALIASAKPEELRGADLYVTLEPCAHHGKTPPCADAVIAAGFRSCHYAVEDPNPLTRGQGAERCRDAGLEVSAGLLAAQARWSLAPYLKWVRTRRPLVTAKWAMTLDGRIAAHTGDSQWISGPEALERTRGERRRYDAILVGRGTQRSDDPRLSSRDPADPQPTRVLLDSSFGLSDDAQLVRTADDVETIVFGSTGHDADQRRLTKAGVTTEVVPRDADGLDLASVLERLGERGVCHLLVEGGGEVLGSFFDDGAVDRVQVIVAAKIIGGSDARSPVGGVGVSKLADALMVSPLEVTPLGLDQMFFGAITAAGRGE